MDLVNLELGFVNMVLLVSVGRKIGGEKRNKNGRGNTGEKGDRRG